MPKVFLLLASVVFAIGVMTIGALAAFADDGSDQEGSPNTTQDLAAGSLSAQDGEQNYAEFDSSTGTLTFYYGVKPADRETYDGYDTATTPYAKDADRPWYSKKSSIKHVVFDPSVSGHLKPKNTAWWFYGFYSLEDVSGLSNLDTSDVRSMAHMFDDCRSKLTTLDLSSFNTANVTDMTGLFNSCQNLSSLTLGESFTTANVTTMERMFAGCSALTSLDVSHFNTANVESMNQMFSGCSKLSELDLTSFNTSNVLDMAFMFSGCSAFTDCGTKLRLGAGFDTSKVTTMESMFQSCTKMATLTLPASFSTANVTSMHRMFYGCSALTDPDLSGFETSKVTYFSSMFERCTSLTNPNVPFNTESAESKPTTGNEKAFDCMFLDCSNLESVTLGPNFAVTKQAGFTRVFEGCVKLQQIPDLSKCITSNVSSLSRVFYGCKGLTNVDLSNLNLSSVEDMQSMFEGCTNLATVTFGNLNSGKLINMNSMFNGCSKLTSVNFASLATGNRCSMNSLFYNCTSLENFTPTTWDTSNVASMNNLFHGCSKLATLDLSSWNTKSVDHFNSTFDGCSKLTSVTLGENFSFGGTNSIEWVNYWALLPEPSKTAPFNGLWWKGQGTTTYSRYTMRYLPASDIAGTWTWSEGIAVTASVSPLPSGTVSFSPLNTGSTGDVITLTATPADGYEFTGWQHTSGENTGELGSTTDNPTTFTLGLANGTVKATFAEAAYAYNIGALSQTSFTYNGSKQVPTVMVTDASSGAALAAGEDYNLTFQQGDTVVASPTNAGVYTAYVTGKGKYSSMAKAAAGDFTITQASSSIALAGQSKTYTGTALAYTGTVTKSGSTGTVSYAYYSDAGCTKAVAVGDVKNAGVYYVKATLAADDNYKGATSSATKFTINPAQVTPAITLAATSYTYDGKVKTPKATVKAGKTTLKEGVDYTATYAKGRKNVGGYTVKVACKGNYSFASKTLSFGINPIGTSVKAPVAAKKALTVKWAKQAKKMSSSTVTGYQVQVATDKAFKKNVKKSTVKGWKKTSVKVTKLKAKTSYYVRVRTYKTVGKATYYSAWSVNKKAVKTK